jgi:hypothetical protein
VCPVGSPRLPARTIDVHGDDGIEGGVVLFDARQVQIE